VVVLRVIGWLLIVAALLALGWDIFLSIHDASLHMTPALAVWHRLSPGSLDLVQSAIEHIAKPAWDPIAVTVLRQAIWLVLGIPGLVLAFIARTRKRRRFAR
jgi:hypothetical protein